MVSPDETILRFFQPRESANVLTRPIGDFVETHPTVKMLALSFLLLIGVTLMAEGFGVYFPKGYIYFAMAFAFGVETLNIRVRKRRAPEVVRLRKAQLADLLPPDQAG